MSREWSQRKQLLPTRRIVQPEQQDSETRQESGRSGDESGAERGGESGGQIAGGVGGLGGGNEPDRQGGDSDA